MYIFKDNLKEKEQVIRKYEQEIDSLSFRNQQLSKRVLFLQDELESAEVNKKKNKVCVYRKYLVMYKHMGISYQDYSLSLSLFIFLYLSCSKMLSLPLFMRRFTHHFLFYHYQKGGDEHHHEPQNSVGASSVFGEELKSKIEENAKLHKQVS